MVLLPQTLIQPYGRTTFVEKKDGKDEPLIGAVQFSLISVMYNVSRLSLSITVGATLNKVGKKNYVLIGFSSMIIANIGFALTSLIGNHILFLIICMILNFFMGIGGTCLSIPA